MTAARLHAELLGPRRDSRDWYVPNAMGMHALNSDVARKAGSIDRLPAVTLDGMPHASVCSRHPSPIGQGTGSGAVVTPYPLRTGIKLRLTNLGPRSAGGRGIRS